jgi:hypothetical protein
MSSDNGVMPPILMFRSFLTIASGLVAHWVILSGVTIAVAHGLFPEYVAEMMQANQPGEQVSAAVAFGAIPTAMHWIVIGIVSLLSIILGMLVGWSAPFGRLVHAIFLAVIVGVNFLSRSISAPQEEKVVMMTYVLIFPLAIFIGGYLINRWLDGASAGVDGTDAGASLL